METVEIVRVENDPRLLEQAFLIRQRVFVEEQGVPAALEFDASDAAAVHLLGQLVHENLHGGRRRPVDATEVEPRSARKSPGPPR